MTKNNEVAADKGCEATIKLLQTQVHAYEIEKGKDEALTLEKLLDEGYVDNISCPNGKVPTFENRIVGPPS